MANETASLPNTACNTRQRPDTAIIHAMEVLTPGSNNQGGQRDFLARLESGQQLRAVALENVRDGRVRVQVGSRAIHVNTNATVNRGDTLFLQVTRDQSGIEFRLLDRVDGRPMMLRQPASGLQNGQHIVARLLQSSPGQWLLRSDNTTLSVTPPPGANDRPGQALLLQALGQPVNRLRMVQRLDNAGSLLWVQGRDMQQWRSLSVGQQLSALAMETVKPTAGQATPVRVMVGENVMTLETRVAVQRNQQLQLQLVRLDPQPMLQITSASNAPVAPWQWLQAHALPRQQHVAGSLAGLYASAAPAAANAPPGSGWLDSLLRLIPGLGDLTRADSLRNAVFNSGLFLEARLAHAASGQISTMLARDLKAQLSRINSSLDPRSPIARMVDGLLADIELQQARSLHARHQGDERLALTLLMRDQQDVHAIPTVIEREPEPESEGEGSIWRVKMQLDFETLGSMTIIVSYSENRGVGVRFISDQIETRHHIDAMLERLREQLTARKLDIMGLSVTSPQAEPHGAPQMPSSTISLKA